MVRVPLPQVSENPGRRGGAFSAPGVRPAGNATPGQISQLGDTLLGAGTDLANRANDLKERLHVAASKEALALAEERIVEADRDYLGRFGKHATGQHREAAWEQLSKSLEGVESALEHEEERTLFRQVIQRRLTNVTARWNNHEDTQVRAYEIGAGEAALAAKVEAARSRGPGGSDEGGRENPESAAYLRFAVKAEATLLAQKRGLPPEMVEAFVAEKLGEVHAGVVEGLVDSGRGTEAADYLANTAAGEVTEDVRAKLQRLVRRASVTEEAAALAVQIRNDLPDDSATLRDTGRSEARAMFEAGKISVEVRDALIGEIDRMAGEKRQAEVRVTEDLSREGESWLLANPGANVESMPPSLYDRLHERGLIGQMNGFAASGNRYVSDPQVLAELYSPNGSELFQLPQDEFAMQMRRTLSTSDFKTALRLYAAANQQVQEAPAELTSVLSVDELIKEGAVNAGILSREGIRTDQYRSESFFRFQKDVEQRVQQFEIRYGRQATHQEIEGFVNEATLDKVYRDTTLASDQLQQISTFTDEQQADAYLDTDLLVENWRRNNPDLRIPDAILESGLVYVREIADDVRTEIIDQLRTEGVPVTEASIATRWILAGKPRGDG